MSIHYEQEQKDKLISIKRANQLEPKRPGISKSQKVDKKLALSLFGELKTRVLLHPKRLLHLPSEIIRFKGFSTE